MFFLVCFCNAVIDNKLVDSGETCIKVSPLPPLEPSLQFSGAAAAATRIFGRLFHYLAALTVSVVSLFGFLVGDVHPGLCTEKNDAPSKPLSSVSDISAATGMRAHSLMAAQTQQPFQPSEQHKSLSAAAAAAAVCVCVQCVQPSWLLCLCACWLATLIPATACFQKGSFWCRFEYAT